MCTGAAVDLFFRILENELFYERILLRVNSNTDYIVSYEKESNFSNNFSRIDFCETIIIGYFILRIGISGGFIVFDVPT